MNNSSILDREILLCNLDDLEKRQAIELDINGRRLFAVRQEDQLYAYWNICPHLGIPLNWMPDRFLDLEGTLIPVSYTHLTLPTIYSV